MTHSKLSLSRKTIACAALLAPAALMQASCSSSPDGGDERVSASVDSAWSAPGCGSVIGSWNGTSAYSNGGDTGTGYSCAGNGPYGLEYQCVELVMRYFRQHWGLSWSGNARDLLNNAPRSAVDVYYNGDGAHPPLPGDMIVWSGGSPSSHVALVTAVSASTVSILEQNVWGTNGYATLSRSGGTVGGPIGWGWSGPAGWAHAMANGGGGGGGGSDPCAHATYGGAYCGQSNEYGFGPGTTDDLYTCQNHATASKTACAAGCEIMPAGQNDACRYDPCTHAAYGGAYCGQSTQYGFGGGVSGWLYTCGGGRTTNHVACSRGCAVMPPGQEDHCQ